MDNFEDAYFKLFNSITDIVEQLQDVQCQAEDLYIAYGEHDKPKVKAKARKKGYVTK